MSTVHVRPTAGGDSKTPSLPRSDTRLPSALADLIQAQQKTNETLTALTAMVEANQSCNESEDGERWSFGGCAKSALSTLGSVAKWGAISTAFTALVVGGSFGGSFFGSAVGSPFGAGMGAALGSAASTAVNDIPNLVAEHGDMVARDVFIKGLTTKASLLRQWGEEGVFSKAMAQLGSTVDSLI